MATRIFRYHGLRGETLPFNTGARRTFLPSRARAMPGVPWGAVPHPYSRARAYGGFGETAAEAAAAKAAAEKAAAAASSANWAAGITASTTAATQLFGMYQATTEAAHRRRMEARLVSQGITPGSMMPAPTVALQASGGGGGGGGGILLPLLAAAAMVMKG